MNRCRLRTVGSMWIGVPAVTLPDVRLSIQLESSIAAAAVVSAMRIFFASACLLGDEEARFLGFFSFPSLHFTQNIQISMRMASLTRMGIYLFFCQVLRAFGHPVILLLGSQVAFGYPFHSTWNHYKQLG